MKKRFLSVFVAIIIAACCFPFSSLAAESLRFSDVAPGDWFAPYVDVCVEEGLMQGTGEGKFSPEQYVTTGECVLLAVRLDRLRKGLEGPLPQAPEGWGSVIVTGKDGTVLFGTEDYRGYHSSGDEDVICLPPEAVEPLVGQAGTLTVNGTVSFDGQFAVNQDPESDWDWAGLAFQDLTYREFETITGGYSLAGSLASAPDWVWDGIYYAQQEELSLGYLDPEISLYPATRLGFLTALEGVMDPRELDAINTVEVLPDVPADNYITWTEDGRSGTSGNFGDFYRAGVLSGTDEYGTFNGDWPLTRAEAAAMLARLLRPELRLRFTPTPYPWETEYELADLDLSAQDWWNGGDTNWIFPESTENLLDMQLLRVSRRIYGSNIDYDTDGVFTLEGEWLVEPGRYGDIGNFGPDSLALAASTHYMGTAQYGVIDRQGREVLPAVYDTIGLGGDGHIVAGMDDEVGYTVLNARGREVGRLPEHAAGAYGVREGLALYQNEDLLWGYMDLEGKVVIPARFETAGLFYDGLAAVVLDGKLGYIDAAGELAIPCQFEAIDWYDECHFQDGAAIVTDDSGLALVIDRQGQQISPRRYDYLIRDGFSPNGYTFYQYIDEENEELGEGFIDTQGREHPLPEYNDPYQFMAYSGGYYLVYWTAGGGYNYMDQQGNILLPLWFYEASPLNGDGQAMVRTEDGRYCRLELK